MQQYKNVLIGINTFSHDWLITLQKIKKPHIILNNFNNFNNNNNILKNTIIKKKINYILPLSNTDYEIIKNNTIYDDVTILYPNIDTYNLLNNKLLFTQFMLENFSEYIPNVYYLDNKNIKDITDMEYPVISKPIYSVNGANMKIYYNHNEFLECESKIIIQQFIKDEYEYSGYILCINGQIINWKIIKFKYEMYTIKKRNFPQKYENDKIFDIKIFDPIIIKLNYTGIMCIDFKFNDITNKIYIFEINPRCGGSAFTCNFIYELLCIK